jgi:hypothetical protein
MAHDGCDVWLISLSALPRRVASDDIYKGHYILKDSLVLASVWEFLHDP